MLLGGSTNYQRFRNEPINIKNRPRLWREQEQERELEQELERVKNFFKRGER